MHVLYVLVWFTSNPVDYNTLGGVVKKLCHAAGIEGNFTNHSLRATTGTRGLAKGIPDKLIMERTGHRDVRSLQQYQRPSVEYTVQMSKAFDEIMHEPLAITKAKGKECQEVSKTAKKELEEGSDMNEGDSTVKRERAEKCVNFSNCTFSVSKDFKV